MNSWRDWATPILTSIPRIKHSATAQLLLAAALGAVGALGFAPLSVPSAPTFCIAGLFWLCTLTPSRAALQGFVWGLGFFLCGVSWVYVSMSQFAGLHPAAAAGATVAFCGYLALFPALAAALFARWRRQLASDAVLFAALWTLSECLRGHLFTGFPWLALGYSQSPPSPLAGWAPLFGVYGLSFGVALSGALAVVLLGELRRTRRIGRFWLVWLGWALIPLGGLALSLATWTQPTGAPLGVSLLQGNVPQNDKWDPNRIPMSIDAYIDLAQRHPAELTVLPETALPLFYEEVPPEIFRRLTRHGSALFGIALTTPDGGYSNAAVAIDTASGAKNISAYAKRHLVPFGEYAPPGFRWFFDLLRIPMSSFSPGAARQPPLPVGAQRIAVNICYEDAFGEELLDGLANATLLVNLSNTAWFGRSLAQPQHLQIAQLRALETGRTVLRATNTGMTAMIGPDGAIAAALPAFTAGALTVRAQGYTGLTPYARWGNLPVLLLATLIVGWIARNKKS